MTTAERLEQKGLEPGKLEDARNLLENGVSLEIILESTGLTEEQLRQAGIVE